MKTGRPVDPDSKYRMQVHKLGKRRYASTQPYSIGEDGKKKYVRKHWGTLDEDNVFWPNDSFVYHDVEERKKFIFPEDWDLSHINELRSERKRGRVAYSDDDVDRQYGPTWFLNEVAQRVGIIEDLNAVFKGNKDMVDDILTMAYFPFIDNLSYNQLASWQKEVKTPSSRSLDSTSITRLTQSITEQNRMDLFSRRSKRIGKDELCAVDSTSISTYGFNLVDIRWGKNKEKLPLRQTLEVVVYSLTSHSPIYYKELPGNMPDCRTIELIMTELSHAGFNNLILVTDRGYESTQNFERYIAKGQKVITCVVSIRRTPYFILSFKD